MFDDPMPNLYVSRRVPIAAEDVRVAFEELPETVTNGAATLVTGPDRFATLRWGRWRPAFRVELEVIEWSDLESEVAIRPAGNGAVRRPSVYATAAGYAVDELVDIARRVASAARTQAVVDELVDEMRRAS